MASGMADPSPHHIVVVGGGAGGLELATAWVKNWKERTRANHSGRSQPHPYLEAAAPFDRGGKPAASQHELNYLAQAHWRHFRYRNGEMCGLDRANRAITLAALLDEDGREISPRASLRYDTLVVAVGSVTNDFGTPGAAEFAVPLDTPEQASRFNRRLVNACLRAQNQIEPIRPGQLHVGSSARAPPALSSPPNCTIPPARSSLTARQNRSRARSAHCSDRGRGAHTAGPAAPDLGFDPRNPGQLGVELRTGARVAEVMVDGVRLADGQVIPSELVVWAAGVKAPSFLAGIDGLETNRINQLVVRPTLQTTRDDNIFAIGDCACCPRPGDPQPVPPRAQAAHQMAEFMFGQLQDVIAGRPLREFAYHDFGSLVSLGKYSTVGSLMGFLVGRGFFVEGLFARLCTGAYIRCTRPPSMAASARCSAS